jgi:hypothetical protein
MNMPNLIEKNIIITYLLIPKQFLLFGGSSNDKKRDGIKDC